MVSANAELDLFEPGTEVFTGTVKAWDRQRAELWTDSGFSVHFVTQGQSQVREGAHVTVVARKYRPRYHVVGIRRQ
jgi:hypothetical protein